MGQLAHYGRLYRRLLSWLGFRNIFYMPDRNDPHRVAFEKYFANGSVDTGGYRDGKLDGPYRVYHPNGRLKEKYAYKDGKPFGLYETYFESGQLFERYTVDDCADGPYESYYDNGQLHQQGSFKKGKDGLWKEYDKDGSLKARRVFRNGERLKGQEAEDYLNRWLVDNKMPLNRGQKAFIKDLEIKLCEAGNLDKARIDTRPARTPERTEIAARMRRVRRERDVIRAAADKARKIGDEDLFLEVSRLAKPALGRAQAVMDKFYARREARRMSRPEFCRE